MMVQVEQSTCAGHPIRWECEEEYSLTESQSLSGCASIISHHWTHSTEQYREWDREFTLSHSHLVTILFYEGFRLPLSLLCPSPWAQTLCEELIRKEKVRSKRAVIRSKLLSQIRCLEYKISLPEIRTSHLYYGP